MVSQDLVGCCSMRALTRPVFVGWSWACADIGGFFFFFFFFLCVLACVLRGSGKDAMVPIGDRDEWWRLMPPGTSADRACPGRAASGPSATAFVRFVLPIYLVELVFQRGWASGQS